MVPEELEKSLSSLEEELNNYREQEKINKSLNNKLIAGIILLKNNYVISANDKVLTFLNFSHNDLIGLKLLDICPIKQPNGRPSFEILDDALLLANNQVIEIKGWQFEANRYITFELYISSIKNQKDIYSQVEIYESVQKKSITRKLKEKNKVIESLSEERESLNEELRATLDELVEVNKQLTESETWNKSIVNNIPLGLMVINKYQIEYVNEKLSRIMGYSVKEMEGKSINDYALPEELAKIKEFYDKKINTGSSTSIELWKTTKDGIKVFLRNQYVKLNEKRWMIITTDLTDEKIKETQIIASQERLEFAIEANESVIWDIDLSNESSRYGDNFGKMFGYEPGDLAIDKNMWQELTHPDDLPFVLKELNRHFIGEVPFYESECRIKTKKGDWKWVLTRGKVFKFDKTGKPSRFIGMFIDISKRKKIEQELIESESRFRSIVTNTPVVFFSINNKGFFTLLEGKEISKFISFPGNVVGAHFTEVYKENPKFLSLVNKALTGDSISDIINVGSYFFETHLSPVYDEKGIIKAIAGVSNDITDEQLAEENLRFSEEKFSKAFNTSVDSILITNLTDNRIVDVNHGFLINTGFKKEDVIGKTTVQLNIGLNHENQLDKVAQLLKENNKVQNFEIIWKLPSKELLNCLLSAEIIKIKDWQYVIYTIHDITKIRLAEEKLKHSEERFRAIIQYLSDIILVVDDKMNILYESPSVSRLFGYEPGFLIGKNGFDIIFPDDKDLVQKEFRNLIEKTNDFMPTEMRVRHKNGNWVYLEVLGENLSEHPAVGGILITARNITERKESYLQLSLYRDQLESLVKKRTEEIEQINAELIAINEELKATNEELADKIDKLNEEIKKRIEAQILLEISENKFRSFIEQSTEGITLIDESGKIVDWNKGMESIFRISREEIINTYAWEFDYRFIPEKRKSPEIFEELKSSIMDYLSNINKTNVMTVEGLYMTMELKQKYLNVTIFPVITSNRKYVGRIFRDVTGIRRAQAEIQKQSEELKLINENLEQQKSQLEKTLLELKKAQVQLIQSEKMASLGILTAGVAHEINNPINYINTALEGLKITLNDLLQIYSKYEDINVDNIASKLKEVNKLKTKLDYPLLQEGIKVLFNNTQTGIEHITEIIKSLRSFARVEVNELKTANINELLDTTLIMLQNQYKNRIEIIKKYSKLPSINCYSGKLNQVFMNILSNAIQAISYKGTISIATYTDPEKSNLSISIADSGIGIEDDIKEKIFEPFFTTKEAGKGTGLGLSITYGIIQQHHGNIEVKSIPGIGTEFIITLPMNLK